MSSLQGRLVYARSRDEMMLGKLAILPGVTHYDLATQPAFAATVERFLTSFAR